MSKAIFIILLFIALTSCQQKDTAIKEVSVEKNQNTEINNEAASANKIELNDFIGQYEFRDTDNPKESLFLMMKKVDVESIQDFEGFSWEEKNEKGEVVRMTLTGLLYGNTDLFDDTREGYAPGFFVVNSQIEPYENSGLKLSLNVKESDILENPV
ncbi:hypothetical protein ABGT15_04755 [Flavobacterium enshiense]|uniref:hypothetical protein n=1 Tax=Flavobacterium enshiense TaxID=1341165 RepID=UPI00345C832F